MADSYPYQVCESLTNLGITRQLKGIATIGDAGRFSGLLREHLNVTGPAYSIHDSNGWMDCLVRGSIQLGASHVPFDYSNVGHTCLPEGTLCIPNDISSLSLWYSEQVEDIDIPSASVDLVTVMPGFHHYYQDQLEILFQIIFRILRPGGILCFREHDARPEVNETFFQEAADRVLSISSLRRNCGKQLCPCSLSIHLYLPLEAYTNPRYGSLYIQCYHRSHITRGSSGNSSFPVSG